MAHPVSNSDSRDCNRYGLALMFLSVGIDLIGVSMITPVIAFYALKFDASKFMVGVVFAAYALAQMVSVPVSGKLSDRYGRKPLLLASLLGSCLGFLVQATADSIYAFIAGRLIAGAFGGSMSLAAAYIADTVSEKDVPKAQAKLGSVVAASFMLGPGIGAGLGELGLNTPMFVASGVAALGFIVTYFHFQESCESVLDSESNCPGSEAACGVEAGSSKRRLSVGSVASSAKDGEERVTERRRASRRRSIALLEGVVLQLEEEEEEDLEAGSDAAATLAGGGEKPEVEAGNAKVDRVGYSLVGLTLLSVFASTFNFVAILSLGGIYFFILFGWRPLEFGFVMMVNSSVGIGGQLLLFTALNDRFGTHATGIVGGVLNGTGVVLLSFLGDDINAFSGMPLLCIGMGLSVIGGSLVSPAGTTLLSRYVKKGSEGFVMGLSGSLQAMARVVAPLTLAALLDRDLRLPWLISGCVGMVSGLALCVALLVERRSGHKHNSKPSSCGRDSSVASVRGSCPPREADPLHQLQQLQQQQQQLGTAARQALHFCATKVPPCHRGLLEEVVFLKSQVMCLRNVVEQCETIGSAVCVDEPAQQQQQQQQQPGQEEVREPELAVMKREADEEEQCSSVSARLAWAAKAGLSMVKRGRRTRGRVVAIDAFYGSDREEVVGGRLERRRSTVLMQAARRASMLV